MTQIALASSPVALRLELGAALRLSDEELFEVCARNPGLRIELVDPQERRVHVYRPGRPVEVLNGPAEVCADPELSGFVLELGAVWAPL